MKTEDLVNSQQSCCGCGACYNACPVGAIIMCIDSLGFEYPEIDSSKCISCGRCIKVCSFSKVKTNTKKTLKTYALSSLDKAGVMNSTSGGAFYQIAKVVLKSGGVVYGTAWDLFDLRVTRIDKAVDLDKLQGSKYAQSSSGMAFQNVKTDLIDNRIVLFSGTPCQVSGLYSFLNEDYDNLYTIDIVCHGVPSCQMLKDELKTKSDLSCVSDIKFRDKKRGWGTLGSYRIGKKLHYFDASNSAFYFYFLKGSIYRDCCYHCRFPSDDRCGDITIGDYWGVEKKHGKEIQIKNGVSCVLVNSSSGEKLLSSIENAILLSTDENYVRDNNAQLKKCVKEPDDRKLVLHAYSHFGWDSVVKMWKSKEFANRIVLAIKNRIPYNLKVLAKGTRLK